MVDDSEDGPTFVRQRRNVMVACLVVITVYVLDLQYSAIKILEVRAGSPQNFDIGWAALIWYFLWRLSQCDAPGRVLSWPQGYAHSYLQSCLPRLAETEKYRLIAIDDYYKDLKEKGQLAIQVTPVPTTVQVRSEEEMKVKSARFDNMMNLNARYRQPITYSLGYTLFLNQGNTATVRECNITIDVNDRLYKKAWRQAFLVASLRKQFFSEYYLPFFLAFVCILYCSYHHIVSA